MTQQTQKRLQARHVAACARYQAGHQQQHTPEPFGHFKAEPFGWTDCAETDEGARPLFDQDVIDALLAEIATERALSFRAQVDELEKQRDELLEFMREIETVKPQTKDLWIITVKVKAAVLLASANGGLA